MTSIDLCNIIDPPPADIVQAAEKVRIWMDRQNRGKDWQLAGVCSREAIAVRDSRIADLIERLDRLQDQAKALHRVAGALDLPAGADVTREVLKTVHHMEAIEIEQRRHATMPDDQLDEVLPPVTGDIHGRRHKS